VPQPVARSGYQGQQQSAAPQSIEVDGQQWDADAIRNGALMHADYTQKTQAVAQQRAQYDAASQLVAALQQDPLAAIRELAQATGVDLREAVTGGQGQGGNPDPYAQGNLGNDEGDVDPNSPLGQRIARLEQALEQQGQQLEGSQDREAEAFLDQEAANASRLFEQYGVPFDDEALFQFAVERGIEDVETAAKAMIFDRMVEAASGQPQQLPQGLEQPGGPGGYAPAQGAAASPQGQQALSPAMRQRFAAQTPRGGLQTGAAPAAPAAEPSTFGDAMRQTLAELGVTDWSQIDMQN